MSDSIASSGAEGLVPGFRKTAKGLYRVMDGSEARNGTHSKTEWWDRKCEAAFGTVPDFPDPTEIFRGLDALKGNNAFIQTTNAIYQHAAAANQHPHNYHSHQKIPDAYKTFINGMLLQPRPNQSRMKQCMMGYQGLLAVATDNYLRNLTEVTDYDDAEMAGLIKQLRQKRGLDPSGSSSEVSGYGSYHAMSMREAAANTTHQQQQAQTQAESPERQRRANEFSSFLQMLQQNQQHQHQPQPAVQVGQAPFGGSGVLSDNEVQGMMMAEYGSPIAPNNLSPLRHNPSYFLSNPNSPAMNVAHQQQQPSTARRRLGFGMPADHLPPSVARACEGTDMGAVPYSQDGANSSEVPVVTTPVDITPRNETLHEGDGDGCVCEKEDSDCEGQGENDDGERGEDDDDCEGGKDGNCEGDKDGNCEDGDDDDDAELIIEEDDREWS